MITKNTVTLFTATDGSKHEDLEAAKLASVKHYLGGIDLSSVETVAAFIHGSAPKFIDILTTTPTSLPKARRVNGGRKPRKSKQLEIPADAYVPVKGDPTLSSTVAA